MVTVQIHINYHYILLYNYYIDYTLFCLLLLRLPVPCSCNLFHYKLYKAYNEIDYSYTEQVTVKVVDKTKYNQCSNYTVEYNDNLYEFELLPLKAEEGDTITATLETTVYTSGREEQDIIELGL